MAGETTTPSKPLPVITDLNRPFWDGTAVGELRVQRCNDCRSLQYPINPICTSCLSPRLDWVALDGHGTVFSSIVFHHVFSPAFGDDVPYNVSIVQLDEGVRMWSNVIGTPPEEVGIGDRVMVLFDRVTPEVTIPRFRIVEP